MTKMCCEMHDLTCNDIPIQIDETLLSPSQTPIRYDANVNRMITSVLSDNQSLRCQKLFDILKSEKDFTL